MTKNLAASIHQKLLNHARANDCLSSQLSSYCIGCILQPNGVYWGQEVIE